MSGDDGWRWTLNWSVIRDDLVAANQASIRRRARDRISAGASDLR